ncbi:MAG: NIPSNAP family protein [Burkholderiaceae bacterium]
MIYDLRQYTMAPGKEAEYLKNNEEIGRKIRGDQYGKLEGYWVTEFGTLNRLVHLWEYEDLNQREKLRVELGKNVEWNRDYSPKAQRNLVAKKFDILYPLAPLARPTAAGNIYELRWYKTRPEGAKRFVELLKGALPSYQRFVSQVGLFRNEMTEAVQLSVYRSFDDRSAKLRALEQDPAWQAFEQQASPLLEGVTATILRPAKFSPMQ